MRTTENVRVQKCCTRFIFQVLRSFFSVSLSNWLHYFIYWATKKKRFGLKHQSNERYSYIKMLLKIYIFLIRIKLPLYFNEIEENWSKNEKKIEINKICERTKLKIRWNVSVVSLIVRSMNYEYDSLTRTTTTILLFITREQASFFCELFSLFWCIGSLLLNIRPLFSIFCIFHSLHSVLIEQAARHSYYTVD